MSFVDELIDYQAAKKAPVGTSLEVTWELFRVLAEEYYRQGDYPKSFEKFKELYRLCESQYTNAPKGLKPSIGRLLILSAKDFSQVAHKMNLAEPFDGFNTQVALYKADLAKWSSSKNTKK
jgi:hypothetical protein